MSFWSRLIGRSDAPAPAGEARGSLENPNVPLAGDELLAYANASGLGPSAAGPTVTPQTAMRSTAVYRCVTLLSGIAGSLPLAVYETVDDGRRAATEQREYALLHDEPTDRWSAVAWRERVMVDMLLYGDHFSLIEYDGAGRTVGIMPMPWSSVGVRRNGRRNVYDIRTTDGTFTLDQGDVLHFAGAAFDGLRTPSPISVAGRQAIGASLAMEETVGRMSQNAARPGGVVVLPNTRVSPSALTAMRRAFDEVYAGAANAGRTVFLDHGAEWKQAQMTPADAQMIEQRQFSVTDIARIFGVPPHLVGEVVKSTSWGTGIEQQTLGFLLMTMEPWLKRMEAELKRKLFSRTRFYAEFNRDAIVAMDAKARADLYSVYIRNGVMTPADARRRQNLPFIPGSDTLFIDTTLQPLDRALAPVPAPEDPAAPSPAA